METLLYMTCFANNQITREWLLIGSQFLVAIVALLTPFILHSLDLRSHRKKREEDQASFWVGMREQLSVFARDLEEDCVGVWDDWRKNEACTVPECELPRLIRDPTNWISSVAPERIPALIRLKTISEDHRLFSEEMRYIHPSDTDAVRELKLRLQVLGDCLDDIDKTLIGRRMRRLLETGEFVAPIE
jgi:hypothetical protein